jgi:dinuclear metal center YbgI/SA1388 family protein
MILKELVFHLDRIFNKELALSSDRVGLQIGNLDSDIKKILVALDVTRDVAEEAADKKAGLILSHHPLIFTPLDTILSSKAGEKELLSLAEKGIASYCAHTNYDFMQGGLNDYKAEILGLENIKIIDERPNDEPSGIVNKTSGAGNGRLGELKKPESFKDFTKRVKDRLKIAGLRWMCDSGIDISSMKIKKVASASGSANALTEKFTSIDCDVIVVGEIKYHNALKITDSGRPVIEVGHGESERPAINGMYEKLNDFFKKHDIKMDLLKSSADCKTWRYEIG